jgi:hypothetical protein
MSITLGAASLDPARTAVREEHEEIGGRDARTIRLSGIVLGESTAVDVEAALDAILDAASTEDYTAALSIRSGRRLWVRRSGFKRERAQDALVGSFVLDLEAKSPFEEADAKSSLNWNITASGATLATSASGNVFSEPMITLVATGSIIDPTFGDGEHSLTYAGTVADGETLVLDAATGTVALEGADVTPYTTGLFPRVSPEGTTLTYTDNASSSHSASVTVAYRDRWW